MSLEMLNALAVVVLGGLLLSAVTGVVLMYRQMGELRATLDHLSRTLQDLTEANTIERREMREDTARIHLRIDDLVKRTCQGGSQ